MKNLKTYQKINKCRVCYSGKLEKVGSLGDIAINDFTDKPAKGKICPLMLVKCLKCSLVQLQHNPPQEELYKEFYWYKSGLNQVIVNDLKEIAETGIKMVNLKKGDAVIDIGANDGTLLSFIPSKYYRIGIEPAKNFLKELKKNAEKTISDFWERVQLKHKAKLITAIGMFYDSPDPNLFIKNIKEHLQEDGLFISQLMTLKPMLRSNDVGNICHEHLEYYTYKSLVYLFEKNGLEIFKVKENNINGGSYRLFARHYKKGSIKYKEPKYNFKKFFYNIELNKKKTVEFIKQVTNMGFRVYGYGASTKGNTILQYYGLDKSLIKGIADANPEKVGKYTIGSKISIVSEKEARERADYFFILPYAFLDKFLKREYLWLKGGGQIIVSIPKFLIV